jgi:hypothetical protein
MESKNKYQYKYKLMSRGKITLGKFTDHFQFTFNPDKVLNEMINLCPMMEFKVVLNSKRNI